MFLLLKLKKFLSQSQKNQIKFKNQSYKQKNVDVFFLIIDQFIVLSVYKIYIQQSQLLQKFKLQQFGSILSQQGFIQSVFQLIYAFKLNQNLTLQLKMFTDIYIKEIQQIKQFLENNPISNEITLRFQNDVFTFSNEYYQNVKKEMKTIIDQNQKMFSSDLKIIAQILDTCGVRVIRIFIDHTKIKQKIFRFLGNEFNNKTQQLQAIRIYRRIFHVSFECPSPQIITAMIKIWMETQNQTLRYAAIFTLLRYLLLFPRQLLSQYIIKEKFFILLSNFLLNVDLTGYFDELIINLVLIFSQQLIKWGKNIMYNYQFLNSIQIQFPLSIKKQIIQQIQLFLQFLVRLSIKFKNFRFNVTSPLQMMSKIFTNIFNFTYKIDGIFNLTEPIINSDMTHQVQLCRKLKISNQFFAMLSQSQNYQTILAISKVMEVMVSDMNLDQFNTIIVPFLQKNLGNTKFYYQNNPADPNSKLLLSLCILISKFVQINYGKQGFNMRQIFEQTNIMFIMFNHLQKQYEMFLQVLNREKHRQTRKVMNMCEQSKLKEVLITFMTMIQVGQWEYKINNQIENVLCQSVILINELTMFDYNQFLQKKLNRILEKVHPHLLPPITYQQNEQLEI